MFSVATCTLLNNSFWRKQCFILIIICELLEFLESSLIHNEDTLREEKNMTPVNMQNIFKK